MYTIIICMSYGPMMAHLYWLVLVTWRYQVQIRPVICHRAYTVLQMKWNRLCATFVHIQAKLGKENLLRMARWVVWHCPPDTGFEIQTLEVWGRARYLSATEFSEWMEKKHVCFFQTAETGKQTPNSSVKCSGPDFGIKYPHSAMLYLYR